MLNGWNETTISEYEPPTMGSEDDDEDSESSSSPFVGLFATLSMFMLDVLFINNEEDDL